jgi:hypothetical protein
MYAKSIIEHLQARVIRGAWSRHLGLLPAAMALSVAALPFTLKPGFERHAAPSNLPSAPSASNATNQAPVAAVADVADVGENPFKGLVLASVVTVPVVTKRVATLPLDAQQRAVVGYITHKYGVSSEVVQEFVRTAFAAGKQYGVDPLLVVAMMAVESGYNPIAQSWAGAKGLMQIIPKYHPEKFVEFGGEKAVFDPRVNILVGARIVREYLLMNSGDLFAALQTYAGALADRDSIYTHRVLNEKDQLDALAGFPKTNRNNRVVMQVDPVRPGTLVIPAAPTLVPVPKPVPLTPILPDTAAALPAPNNDKSADDTVQNSVPGQQPKSATPQPATQQPATQQPSAQQPPAQPTAATPVNLTQIEVTRL